MVLSIYCFKTIIRIMEIVGCSCIVLHREWDVLVLQTLQALVTCSSIDLTKLPSTLPQGSITKSRYGSIELVSVEQWLQLYSNWRKPWKVVLIEDKRILSVRLYEVCVSKISNILSNASCASCYADCVEEGIWTNKTVS